MYVSTSTTPRISLVSIQRSGRTLIYHSTSVHLPQIQSSLHVSKGEYVVVVR